MDASLRLSGRAIICVMQASAQLIQAIALMILLTTAPALGSDWDRGVALYNKGDFRRALAEFQDIAQERPDAAGAWYYIGLCEFKLKRYDRVELPLSHAIDLLEIQSPSNTDIAGAWYTIGVSYFLSSQYEKAIAPLNRYIEITTKAKREIDPSARTALARSYFFLDRFDEALPLLAAGSSDKTGDKSKEIAANLYYQAVIYFKREDDVRAAAALREAAKANPEDPAALELLTESLMRRARKTNSAAVWNEAAEAGEKLRAVRDDEKTAGIQGRAFLGAKQFDRAVAPLERIARAETSNGQAWLYYGIALSRSGKMRKAMEALEITIQLMPDSIPAMSELGYVYESDKQYQQALRIYEKAYGVSNDPAMKESMERVRTLAAQQP